MELPTDIIGLITNAGVAGLFIWYLITERRNERAKNDARDTATQARFDALMAQHAKEIEEKDRQILDLYEKRLAMQLQLNQTLAANTNVLAGAIEAFRLSNATKEARGP